MSKRRPRDPIWTRPAPGARRPRLSRDQIARLALAIADAEGFAALSMRRIATELNVATMTLYYYVRTKDDLIALMDDALMAEIVVPAHQLPRGWKAGLATIARSTRDVFARHPWAMQSLQGSRLGPNGLRHIEQSLAVMAQSPFDAAAALAINTIVDDFVFGFVLRASEAQPTAADALTARSINEFTAAQLATGQYPHLERLLGDDEPLVAFARLAQAINAEARFDQGLEALLDGLERLFVRRGPTPPPRRPPRRRRR